MSWQRKLLKYNVADTVALAETQINLVSLWGDSFTDVGYNIGHVETLLGCINQYHCVFWTGLLLKPMVAT